jgi:hypothetical protein
MAHEGEPLMPDYIREFWLPMAWCFVCAVILTAIFGRDPILVPLALFLGIAYAEVEWRWTHRA